MPNQYSKTKTTKITKPKARATAKRKVAPKAKAKTAGTRAR